MEALAVGAGMTARAERGERQIGRAGMTNRIRLKIDWKEPVRRLGRNVDRLTLKQKNRGRYQEGRNDHQRQPGPKKKGKLSYRDAAAQQLKGQEDKQRIKTRAKTQ